MGLDISLGFVVSNLYATASATSASSLCHQRHIMASNVIWLLSEALRKLWNQKRKPAERRRGIRANPRPVDFLVQDLAQDSQ